MMYDVSSYGLLCHEDLPEEIGWRPNMIYALPTERNLALVYY